MTKTRKFLALVGFLFSIVLLGACAGSSTSRPSTVPPDASSVVISGTVADYLNSFEAERFNGIKLPRGIPTDRDRVRSQTEEAFVGAVRSDSNGSILAQLDDDAVVYLGYLYCAARDAELPINRAVALVVDVVARAEGREPAAAVTEDFIASVTIVNLASGSLCPELYLDTRSFLDDLTSGS
ncbi:MAG: hypothetical protein GXP35_14745 [Actinobacteria bacterium]|nr:hypothetical protein [Actinomycetota bacterium]